MYDRIEYPTCMHTVSTIYLWATVLVYKTDCYPEPGMADRLLRVHIQSPSGLWAWMTQSYNTDMGFERCASDPALYVSKVGRCFILL